MKHSNRTLSLAITAAVGILTLGLGSTTANAATTNNTTFTVSASVVAYCSVSATNLNFGTYNGAQIDLKSQVTVTCTNNTLYTVGLDGGSGASVTARQMTSGSNTLNYSLFSDTARTVNWGNTVGTDTVAGTGNGSGQSIPVYGRLPGGQVLNIGTYSDTITATVSY